MRRSAVLVLACAACTHAGSSVGSDRPKDEAATPTITAAREAQSTCGSRWSLAMIGGGGEVVVMCPGDVRRAPLDPNGPLAFALSPALDPARERVCGCASRLRPPPFVDLVFTAKPDEGSVSVTAKGDDDELDPELGPSFVACVGTVVARFAAKHTEACGQGGTATLVYPVRIEIGP